MGGEPEVGGLEKAHGARDELYPANARRREDAH
jgi:hypothetical protein